MEKKEEFGLREEVLNIVLCIQFCSGISKYIHKGQN